MMILLISILIIYLIIISLYFYNKQKKNYLGFKNWKQYFISLFGLVIFFIFFVVFLRLLSFFRSNKIIDLKLFYYNYNLVFIILVLLLFFSLRRLIFLKAKISFFKLHYFYLAPENNNYNMVYFKFYVKILYNFCKENYKFFYWVDKIMLFLLLFFFFKDLIINNFILNDVLYFMKYYSLFKLLFVVIRFIALKQQLMLDYYIYNLCYQEGLSLDEGFFAETLAEKSYEISEYKDNIIRS